MCVPPHLVDAILYAVRLVYVDVARGACCKLASPFVDCDSFQLIFLVDVNSLDDMFRAVEDYEGISGDVRLSSYPSVTIVFNAVVDTCRTMIWVLSHRP
jgi:hypothetical protein